MARDPDGPVMLTETWQEVPSDIDTPVLERAMADLTDFQTNAAYNHFYRSRLDYIRVQNTIAVSMAQVRAETAQALAREEQALAREVQALARSAKLCERLRAAGIDPDGV